jgi:hypothetical protein
LTSRGAVSFPTKKKKKKKKKNSSVALVKSECILYGSKSNLCIMAWRRSESLQLFRLVKCNESIMMKGVTYGEARTVNCN